MDEKAVFFLHLERMKALLLVVNLLVVHLLITPQMSKKLIIWVENGSMHVKHIVHLD